MLTRFLKLLGQFGAKFQPYHIAAAGVWGLILAQILGIIEYNGPCGHFKLGENWFLATVGLSAIMYVALSLLKTAVLLYRGASMGADHADE